MCWGCRGQDQDNAIETLVSEMKNMIGNPLSPLRNTSSNIMEFTVNRDLDEHLLQSWERGI